MSAEPATRDSLGRALGVAASCCVACAVCYVLVGTKQNESGAYAVEAWLRTAHPALVPVRGYPYTGARPLFGLLYLPFFALFGRSMAAWWWGSAALTTFAAAVLGGLVFRRWGLQAVLVFLLAGVASPLSQHLLLSSYFPPVWFAFAVSLLPLYARQAGGAVVASVVVLAWFGTAVHDAMLGIAVAAMLWGLLTARGWLARGAVLLASALGVGWYFLAPVWLFGLGWHESFAANRLVEMVGRLSTLFSSSAHTTYAIPGLPTLTPLGFAYQAVTPTLELAEVPLAILALAAGSAAAWRAGAGTLVRSLWREPAARLLLLAPVVSGLGYAVLTTWRVPLLLRFDSLTLAALAGGLVAACAAALPLEARRALWVGIGVVWCLGLLTARRYVEPSRQFGLRPIRQVAAAIDSVTQPGDTIFSADAAIALQSRRSLLPALFRGTNSRAIYGGETAALQQRFYDEIEHHAIQAWSWRP
jgi:hypothetical protein